MKAQDVTDTLDLALAAPGWDQVRIVKKLRLLSDNDSSYVSAELEDWLIAQDMGRVRGRLPSAGHKARSNVGIKR